MTGVLCLGMGGVVWVGISIQQTYPYGLVKCTGLKDAIIFRIEKDVFHVFIAPNEKGHALNFLQLMMNGDFTDNIASLQRGIS